MKKIISNISILLLVSAISSSCDFVSNVNPPVDPSTTGGGTTGVDISDSTVGSNPAQKKALVEDYTGHKCGNCPQAAIVLKNLETTYPGKIVPLAIHAGFFATTNASYPTNLQTTAGTAYDSQFGNSAAGNPNGLVNRVGYGTGGFIKAYTNWGTEVVAQIAQTPKFQLILKYKYNTGTLKLNADVKVKSLASNTGIYKVVILLTEDKIVAEQLDYSLPVGSQTVLNYEFNHVLRGAINSEWGDVVFSGGAALNATQTVSKTNFQINSTYVPSHCHIVAYIYDADPTSPTYYEVLQSEELELK
jgi:hypothetical protein